MAALTIRLTSSRPSARGLPFPFLFASDSGGNLFKFRSRDLGLTPRAPFYLSHDSSSHDELKGHTFLLSCPSTSASVRVHQFTNRVQYHLHRSLTEAIAATIRCGRRRAELWGTKWHKDDSVRKRVGRLRTGAAGASPFWDGPRPPPGSSFALRSHVEILVEHTSKLSAVAFPVAAAGVVLQACNPVAVELMDGGVDAVAL
jgi:hypothetical protein